MNHKKQWLKTIQLDGLTQDDILCYMTHHNTMNGLFVNEAQICYTLLWQNFISYKEKASR